MLQKIGDKIRLCYEHATDAKRRAGETSDPDARCHFLHMERQWLLLASSYQFQERLEDFTCNALQFRPGPADLGVTSAGQASAKPSDPGRNALRGHEIDVSAILAHTPFLLARVSADLRYRFVSSTYAQMWKMRPEEFVGKPIIEIIGEHGLTAIQPYLEKVLKGEAVEFERDVDFRAVGLRSLRLKYTPDRDMSGTILGYVASIVDVTDQKRAEMHIAADLRAMTILRDIGSLCVREGLDVEDCMEQILDAAIAIGGADKGTLQLFDPATNELTISAHRGFDPSFLTFFARVRDDPSASWAAMRWKKQVIIEDVLTSELFRGRASQKVVLDADVRALTSTPLTSSNGNLMGIISAHYRNPRRPTERETQLLELLARPAADYLERKHTEKVQKTLTHELQHRCNNLLSVVQAIARRSLAGGHTLSQARAAFENRLHALARINRQILRSDWTGVKLNAIVESEFKLFSDKVTIDGVEVAIRPQDAQNLAIALHELATNASKYGALSTGSGTVHISWTIAGNDYPTLKFLWQESGGPPVDTPVREGFGTLLLKGMFPGIRLDYCQEGLRCEFELRLCFGIHEKIAEHV